jgi:hypothetical protein
MSVKNTVLKQLGDDARMVNIAIILLSANVIQDDAKDGLSFFFAQFVNFILGRRSSEDVSPKI